jgi:hypothetical protein
MYTTIMYNVSRILASRSRNMEFQSVFATNLCRYLVDRYPYIQALSQEK